MVNGVRVVRGDSSILEALSSAPTLFSVVIGSTRTSTVPGVSIAGPSPEGTLLTPALDVEYLVAGKPLSLDVIPVTPTGIPTPALVTRASLGLTRDVPVLVADAGSHLKPRIPHITLPSAAVGDRIDSGRAFPPGTAEKLYREARILGSSLGRGHALVVGESIPGGTTTALAILEALGFRGRGRVSSAGPENPHELKWSLARRGIEAAGLEPGRSGVFEVVDAVGDPVHVTIAGIASGALEAGAPLVALAGGTQMAAVLAILSRLGVPLEGRVAVLTTRWIVEDPSSDLPGLLSEVAPEAVLAAAWLDFSGSRHSGLRAYEEGYAKEGVGAGGAAVLAMLRSGAGPGDILRAVEAEYERVTGGGG